LVGVLFLFFEKFRFRVRFHRLGVFFTRGELLGWGGGGAGDQGGFFYHILHLGMYMYAV